MAAERERLSDADLTALVLEEVKRMFATATIIPAPSAVVITRWTADPYSRGAYSYCRVGSPYEADIRALGAAVGSSLYFAGEATSVDYPSTVHGALLSGQRAAKQVLAASRTQAPSTAKCSESELE